MKRLLAILAFLPVLTASDWSRYRGPNGSGISGDTGLPSEVGKDKNVTWKVAIPKGNSSPIVIGGKLILTGFENDDRLVLCFDAATGKELWRNSIKSVRKEAAHPLNGPTTPTPATDGKNVYIFFPEFGLLSYTLEGKERWRAPLGPFASVQGLATSPVYADGVVALLIDQVSDSYLIALDAATGRQRWKVDRPSSFLGSYTTPGVYQPKNGPAQLVVAGARDLSSYQIRTGEKIWWASGVAFAPATLPVLDGDTLYTLEPANEGEDQPFTPYLKYDKNKDGKLQLDEFDQSTTTGAIMHRLMKSIDDNFGNKDGAVDAEEWRKSFDIDKSVGGLRAISLSGQGELPKSSTKWRYVKGLPYVTSPLVYQNVLYVVKNGGILRTFNPETGAVLKQGRLKDATGDYYASPIAADGKIYFIDKEGKLTILKAGGEWEILSTTDLDEQAIATPAIANSKLYVRTMGTLYCFGKGA